MYRIVRLTLSAGATALVCACTSDGPQQPLSEPLSASFSDGAHSGNPDFFFLPPIFKSPTTDPNFSTGEFNAALQPTVEICELGTLVPPATIRPCVATITTFAGSAVTLDAANEQYRVNWNTTDSHLVLTKEYRIRVLLGTLELGFADVDPVSNTGQLKNVQTGDVIGLVDGRTLPIKFRIENGAACFGGACDTKTIPLNQGGFVVFTETGDRIDIPAQQSGQVVTITVQACEGLDVDLPVFGNCLRVTASPALTAPLFPLATVSICSFGDFTLPPHPQQDLITVHRQDGPVVVALAHSDDFCGSDIGRAERDAPTTLVGRSWRAMRNVAAWIFKPRELHATTALLDVGAGGQTDGFSDFGLSLPAKMTIVSLAEQVADPGTAVGSVPTVFVTDAEGHPVANARVHFQITSTGGGSSSPATVLSNTDGFAALTQWTLGAAGRHTLRAFGKGIADPANNGPGEGFDPFAPAVFHDPDEDEAQPPVTLGTGSLTFGAEAVTVRTLIDCAANPGGDQIDRGFYVPSFPGNVLTSATMSFSSRTAGTYTLRMTARSGTYAGTVLASATTDVTLTDNDQVNVPATFQLGSVPVTQGSTVTFALEIVSGPSNVVFYSVPDLGSETCPVIQTNGTNPPLDTFRRNGVGIRIDGGAPAQPPIP